VRSANVEAPLAGLRSATSPAQCDDAWVEFLGRYSNTVLLTCRSVAHDYDGTMDAYVEVLEALREDGCRRLLSYVAEPNRKFSSWLIVVTRRLALDHFRHRYGRSRSEDLDRRTEQESRRRLEDLVAHRVDPDQLPGEPAKGDAEIQREQLTRALSRALRTLEPRDRLLLALRFNDERPVREIAGKLSLPTVFHVYRRLDTVLAVLRLSLANGGVGRYD
jgi:RNA polymerase sigma factor (sigma-70 family)